MEHSSNGPKRITPLYLFLGILVLIATGVVLQAAKSVIIPLFIAWLLSYLLSPVVAFFNQKCRIPNVLAVTAVVLLLLLICYGAGLVIQQRLFVFARSFPAYHARLNEIVAMYGAEFDVPAFVLNEIDFSRHIAPVLMKSSQFFIAFFSNATLVLIFLVFMLLAKPYSRIKMREALPTQADRVISITEAISRQISAYLSTLFVLSLATGLIVWGALAWFFNDDFALTWGLLAFVLNFIPTVGSIVASVPPVLIAVVNHYPSLWPAVGVAVTLLAIQMTIGNFIAPKIYGDRLNLSPVVILLFLCFWGWLWGIPGALLAVPIAAGIQITCRHVPALEPIAVLMGSGKKYAQGRKSAKKPAPAPTARPADAASGPEQRIEDSHER